jgi:four helix bundle protein
MIAPNDLKQRTKEYALQIIRVYSALPPKVEASIIGKQVLRSGTSVGAQYREAGRSRSTAEYISKVQGSLQELEETAYWLELLVESQLIDSVKLQGLLQETSELIAIFTTLVQKARQSQN